MMEFKWVWFLRIAVLSVFLLLEATPIHACLEHERIALLQLKPFFNHYNELTDWDEMKGSNCCEWKRIECNTTTQRLIRLSLDSTRSEDIGYWYLNASLFLPFVELKSLYLPGNAIAGCIQNEGFTKLSSSLSNLEILDLSHNFLNDSIMSSLSGLSSLRYLSLAYNRLEGSSHPNDETQLRLTKLEQLDLSDNLFGNNTFSFFKGLSNLKSLIMRWNNFQGSLDIKELSHLTKLKKLDLSFNQIERLRFSKDDVTKLQQLGHLQELHLDGNLLNNSVFASFNEFSNLKYLSISHNRLKGSLDLNVSSNLEALILDYSLLDANILRSIGALTSLKTLSLSSCGLTGSLPTQGLCYLRNLETLDLSLNELGGMLPYCLSNLTSLRVLDISRNKFSRNLSPVTNLTSLRTISLSRNLFQIPISFLAHFSNLKVLLIDENKMVMEPSFYTLIPAFQLKVISFSMCITSQELSPKLPTFLYYQYNLRYVDLSRNNFSGTVPMWLLENNTKLEDLILMGNAFTEPLSLPTAPNFNVFSIDICGNKLHGRIPTGICSKFPNLRRLFLAKNSFEGEIPPCLSGMNYLSFLDLSQNQLSGRVPEQLIMNNSLIILRLSNNNLSGNVVPVILKANGLSQLYLDGNNFYGDMTNVDVSNFKFPASLTDIDLSNNKLYGKLPRWIGNVSHLRRLALSNNSFQGSIPIEFCNLNGLQFLELSENNLSGSIPSCFSPPHIQHVHLHGNRLNGPLSLAFYNSSSLVTLDLRGNNLSGSIPKWIGTLSSLSVLLLKANNFHGRIPVQLCKLYSLSIIDLSQNMFSGPIPPCLGNLTLPTKESKILQHLAYASFSEGDESTPFGMAKLGEDITHYYPESYIEEWIEFATKSGTYKYGGYILEHMAGIDLSCNKLTGQIPLELGNLSQIHSLNLSHNNLIGVIPSTFSKLKQIESLDLSYNNLTGEIPNQLVDLNFLEVFSVSHNNLSGNIPEPKAQFQTFDENSYEGNPFLCGPMLHKSCSKTDAPSILSTAPKDDEEDGFLDIYTFRLSFLVSYAVMLVTTFVVFYKILCWRRV